MALVTGISRKVDIPHEPGEWMELKRLSWRQLEVASDIATEAALKRVKGYDPNTLNALRKMGEGKDEDAKTAQYDKKAVLLSGIIKWSYEAELTADTIDMLDEETATWAYKEILSFNKPISEADRKND